jgi:hypothetical protein
MMGIPPPASTAQAAEFLNMLAMTLSKQGSGGGGGGGDNNQQQLPPGMQNPQGDQNLTSQGNTQPPTSMPPITTMSSLPSIPPTSDPEFLQKLNPKQRELFHRIQGGGAGIDSTANITAPAEGEFCLNDTS